jgi:hypothetical protein
MTLAYIVLALAFLLPVLVAWITWRLTGRVQRAWLRASVRALALAAAFTPTIAPVPSLHGALPMPAVWVLVCGMFGLGSEDRMSDVRYGGIPLLVAFSVVWLISMAVIFFRRDRIS